MQKYFILWQLKWWMRSENITKREEKTVFICPVGPVGQYPYFVDMVNEQNISLKNVWFINMDEYLDDEETMDFKRSSVKLQRLHVAYSL